MSASADEPCCGVVACFVLRLCWCGAVNAAISFARSITRISAVFSSVINLDGMVMPFRVWFASFRASLNALDSCPSFGRHITANSLSKSDMPQ